MPFFSSLIYTGTRVGGQRERQTQAFEAGCAYFPRDFPGTQAYTEYAEDRADEDRATWERKPPAKRPNYEKLGTRSPWTPDWDVVLGLKQPSPVQGTASTGADDEELMDTQRDTEMAEAHAAEPASAVVEPEGQLKPWLLRGPDVPTIVADVSSMLNPAAGLLLHLNQARAKRKLDPLPTEVRAEDLMRTALVQVSIWLCGRGSPEDFAVIYRVDDDEARRWAVAERRRKCGLALLGDGPDETQVSWLIYVFRGTCLLTTAPCSSPRTRLHPKGSSAMSRQAVSRSPLGKGTLLASFHLCSTSSLRSRRRGQWSVPYDS